MAQTRWSELFNDFPNCFGYSQTDLSFGFRKRGNKKTLSIILGETVLERTGWKKGDRFDVVFDAQTGEGSLERSNNGWRLTRQGDQSSRKAELLITYRDEMGLSLQRRTAAEVLEVSLEAVRFRLPLNNKHHSWKENNESERQDNQNLAGRV